tara:strand:+ start:303 stop:680 length:378 start_codon:yes stop_codon:yes gene_type:complete
MYIQSGNTTTIVPPLGFCFLTTDEEQIQVNESIIIEKDKQYPAQNMALKKALNLGLINTLVYNVIINNRGAKNALYLINTGIEINKGELINIVQNKAIQEIDIELTAAQIINQIELAGYMIIKKI